MHRDNLISLDAEGKSFAHQNEMHFRLVRHAYREDMERHKAEVKSRLGQINSYRTAQAPFKDIAANADRLCARCAPSSTANGHLGRVPSNERPLTAIVPPSFAPAALSRGRLRPRRDRR